MQIGGLGSIQLEGAEERRLASSENKRRRFQQGPVSTSVHWGRKSHRGRNPCLKVIES